MDFQRTNRTLRSLEKKNTLTLEDTLGVINDVFADVQGIAGCSPDKLELGELRAALTGLSAVGRVLLQINKTKADEIGTAADRKKRLDKIYGEIENVSREIDEGSDVIEKLSSEQRELENRKLILEESNREAA